MEISSRTEQNRTDIISVGTYSIIHIISLHFTALHCTELDEKAINSQYSRTRILCFPLGSMHSKPLGTLRHTSLYILDQGECIPIQKQQLHP